MKELNWQHLLKSYIFLVTPDSLNWSFTMVENTKSPRFHDLFIAMHSQLPSFFVTPRWPRFFFSGLYLVTSFLHSFVSRHLANGEYLGNEKKTEQKKAKWRGSCWYCSCCCYGPFLPYPSTFRSVMWLLRIVRQISTFNSRRCAVLTVKHPVKNVPKICFHASAKRDTRQPLIMVDLRLTAKDATPRVHQTAQVHLMAVSVSIVRKTLVPARAVQPISSLLTEAKMAGDWRPEGAFLVWETQ